MTISAINLGNTFTNNSGSTVLGGLSSGLNTQSVISSIVAAQSAQLKPLNDQVTVNNSQLSALTNLQQLLTALQTAATPLSNPSSPDPTNNLWAVNASNITSNTSQPATNFVTADVTSGATTGTYNITNITQLATATTQDTTTTFSSATAAVVVTSGSATSSPPQFNAGSFTLTGPLGSGTVTLNTGDSLTAVANDFNQQTTNTGISASVLQTAPGAYRLVFKSTTTGAASLFDLGNTATTSVTDTNTNKVFANISFQTMTSGVNEGQNASFDFNGINVVSPTNTLTGLIPGVTVNLLQNTNAVAGANITINIAPDTTSIAAGITSFANAYNSFLAFYTTQTQLNSSGTPASAAVLYSDTTLRSVYNQVTNEASSLINGITGSNPNSLAGIGISFAVIPANGTTPAINNSLSINSAVLQSSLQTEFSAVANVFGANLVSTSTNLGLFQSPTVAGVTNFTLTVSGGTYTANYTDPTTQQSTNVTLTSAAINGGGVVLKAPSGTALSGLQLIYTGDGSDSPITISSLSQGIADQINNSLTGILKPNTGLIAEDQTAIQTRTTSVQTNITNVTNQIATTRTQLLQKFATLETAIAQANSSLNLLNAQQLANSNPNG